MRRIAKDISRSLMGNEEGLGLLGTFLLAVGTGILIFGVAVYGGSQAGGAMSNYSRSSPEAHDTVAAPATQASQEKLDEIQQIHSQGGTPVMVPVLEAGIKAQGAGGPQNFGISYTIGHWITKLVDWATGKTSKPSNNSQTTPTVTGEDLDEHTNVTNITDDAASAGGGSGGSSGGCSDGCAP